MTSMAALVFILLTRLDVNHLLQKFIIQLILTYVHILYSLTFVFYLKQVGEDLVGTLFCVQSKWFKVNKVNFALVNHHILVKLKLCSRDYSASVGFSLAATSCAASAVAAGKLTKCPSSC